MKSLSSLEKERKSLKEKEIMKDSKLRRWFQAEKDACFYNTISSRLNFEWIFDYLRTCKYDIVKTLEVALEHGEIVLITLTDL